MSQVIQFQLLEKGSSFSLSHELTTAMHHLSYTLEGFSTFIERAVRFLALVRFLA